MKFEEIAKKIIKKYEKPVIDYHYKGKVIYPDDALKMMQELYLQLRLGNRHKPKRFCPYCGTKDVIPIMYGLPDEEGMAAIERGEYRSGGCVVDNNNMYCKECKRDFQWDKNKD